MSGTAVAPPPPNLRRFHGWQCNCHPNDVSTRDPRAARDDGYPGRSPVNGYPVHGSLVANPIKSADNVADGDRIRGG